MRQFKMTADELQFKCIVETPICRGAQSFVGGSALTTCTYNSSVHLSILDASSKLKDGMVIVIVLDVGLVVG